jgi:DNA-binding HxlR family transcriptional regulator
MAVRGSRTGRPINHLLDILGRRWTLRIIYELANGPYTFRELQKRCDNVSPTVLNQRLRELKDVKLVKHEGAGYELSQQTQELTPLLFELYNWAEGWASNNKN